MDHERLREIDGRTMVDVTGALAAIVVHAGAYDDEQDGTPVELEAWASGITRAELAQIFQMGADHWARRTAHEAPDAVCGASEQTSWEAATTPLTGAPSDL